MNGIRRVLRCGECGTSERAGKGRGEPNVAEVECCARFCSGIGRGERLEAQGSKGWMLTKTESNKMW
ncbi:MAG: hypothetical protein ACTS4T_01825 [Candidatus Hodgkinia cicadicola]